MYRTLQKVILIMVLLIGTMSFYTDVHTAAHAATIENGTYTIDYLIKKPDDESVSMANDYWAKPATVIVEDGQITVKTTINYSQWVTQFKVPSGDSFIDATTISSNSEEDTRIAQFTIDSLDQPILSKIHVTVPEINYDHDYTIRFVFDISSLMLISKPEATTTPEKAENATSGNETTTATDNAGASIAEQKDSSNPGSIELPAATAATSTKPDASATPHAQPSANVTSEPTPSSSSGRGSTTSQTASSSTSLQQTDAGSIQTSNDQAAQNTEPALADSKHVEEEKAKELDAKSVVETNASQSAKEEVVELDAKLESAQQESSSIIATESITKKSDRTWLVVAILIALIVIAAVSFIVYRKRHSKST